MDSSQPLSPSEILPELTAKLAARFGDLTGEEIAEVLWLTLELQKFENPVAVSPTDTDEPAEEKIGSPKRNPSDTDSIKPVIPPKRDDPVRPSPQNKTVPIYNRNPGAMESGGIAIAIPEAPSLREPLTFARAFRPLLRKVAIGRESILDEAATVQRSAEERICFPVLKPEAEIWLDLALVIDESHSMLIWGSIIRELKEIFKKYGIFREIKIFGLQPDETGEKLQIFDRTGSSKRSIEPGEISDPTGRRLVILVSDCVSNIWRKGMMLPALKLWTRKQPLVILQMLPAWMWKRTALDLGIPVAFKNSIAGATNRELSLDKPLRRSQTLGFTVEEIEDLNRVPVISLEPERIDRWCQVLSGKADARAAGYLLPSKLNEDFEDEEFEEENFKSEEATERVRNFRMMSSPIARRLAGLLAVSPVITLPVVRLIQESLLPESNQIQIAEVFLGGILRPKASSLRSDEINPEAVEYEFIEGVRDIFLEDAPVSDSIEVINGVSRYVAEQLGISLRDFMAVLKGEQEIDEEKKQGAIEPFARITARVLRKLGGEYTKIADQLDNPNHSPNIDRDQEPVLDSIDPDREPPLESIQIEDILGDYECHLYDGTNHKNDYHYVTISKIDDRTLLWKNRAGVSWTLTITPDRTKLDVGEDCPYNNERDNYRQATVVWNDQQKVVGLKGPFQEMYDKLDRVEDILGDYECHLYDGTSHKNDYHYVTISSINDRTLLWKNRAGVSWTLTITPDRTKLDVGEDCPYNNERDDHRQATVVWNDQQKVVGLKGPFQEMYDKLDRVDPTRLEQFLKGQRWSEADRETHRLILQIAGRENAEHLASESIAQLPCEDLQKIDELWMNYSHGSFGFSRQNKIYQDAGGTEQYKSDIFERFAHGVGWILDEQNRVVSRASSVKPPNGNLPSVNFCRDARDIVNFFSHLTACNIQDTIIPKSESSLFGFFKKYEFVTEQPYYTRIVNSQKAIIRKMVGAMSNGFLQEAQESILDADYILEINHDGRVIICNADQVPYPQIPLDISIDSGSAPDRLITRLLHLAKYHLTLEINNPDTELSDAIEFELLDANKQAFPDRNNIVLQSGDWAYVRLKNISSEPLNIALLDFEPTWEISQLPILGNRSAFYSLQAGEETFTRLRFEVPEGEFDGGSTENLKLFLTRGMVDFGLLTLPSLQELETPRKSGSFSRGSYGVATPDPENSTLLDQLIAKFDSDTDNSYPTRPISNSGSGDWYTTSITITVNSSTRIDSAYKESVTNLSLPPLGVYLEGDVSALEAVRQELRTSGYDRQPSLYVREVKNIDEASYRLLADGSQYIITNPGDSRPPVNQLEGYTQENARKAVENLEHIARWTTVMRLEGTHGGRVPADAVKMYFYLSNGEEIAGSPLRLSYDSEGNRPPTFRLKLVNNSTERLFCTVLDLTENYSISAPLFEGGGMWIEPGEEAWAYRKKPIPATVPDEFWKQGITEYRDILKLIASTAEFDATLLCQEKLGRPKSQTRSVLKRNSTLNRLMQRVTTRDIDEEPSDEIDEWITAVVTVITTRPLASIR